MKTRLQLTRIGPAAEEAQAHGSTWLSQAEHARLAAITSPRRRAEFLAGRWGMRCLLARAHGGDPMSSHWQLTAPQAGPPTLLHPRNDAQDVYFSISHSGDWLACATSTVALGIDLEASTRQHSLQRLIDASCAPVERPRFDECGSDDERKAHFRILWTLKEAHQKMRGEGIHIGALKQLHTQPAPAESALANALVWQTPEMTLAWVLGPGIWPPPPHHMDAPAEVTLQPPQCWTVIKVS